MTDRPAYPEFRMPDPEESARVLAEARRLRAAALRDAFAAIPAALRRLAERLTAGGARTA
jgi:hypothetical protein